ncbi:hypothetical protein GDO81_009380 [Engystomops pustulosus]|uniref:MRG domain-containing protein n=1 Tax=Engystomops pustulosus TaxID=76066 RepID=A0AAV7BQ88_ENGPU|nr:hypothetical protein GDO81_009380 [Engystomops pustulosus]
MSDLSKYNTGDPLLKGNLPVNGRGKHWDEWVPESRVLKYVDTNLQKQKELQKAITPGSGEGSSTSDAPQPPRKKRARVDPTVESEETFITRVEVETFNLPAKKNVETILEEYATYKKSRGNTDNKEYAVNEVVAGIKEYFNVMLGTQLLYKFERPQYADILADHPDAPMSQVYGAPHLLRCLSCFTSEHLHDFLKYLAKNSSTLFSASDYELHHPNTPEGCIV